MSEWNDTKQEFHRAILTTGAWSLKHFPAEYEALLAVIGQERAERWLNRFYAAPNLKAGSPRRLVNRFKLGADPELYLACRGVAKHANGFGLQAARAFGADNNGRLTEIRPFPSRSALHVVTSMWSTMAWMHAYLTDGAKNFGKVDAWLCGPFLFEDGLGGHVHVARKRGLASEQVRSLDRICEVWYKTGSFSSEELRMRNKVGYGKWADTRVQKHGWEYRTFPTWLHSPQLAHLMLTLSKLAVLDSYAVRCIADSAERNPNANLCQRLLTSLLAKYHALDDDAALALGGLRPQSKEFLWPGMPSMTDIRPAWGLLSRDVPPKIPSYFPLFIRPSSGEVERMFLHLTKGTGLVPAYSPTWSPLDMPEGYAPLCTYTSTLRAPGTGELAADFVFPKQINFGLSGAEEPGARITLDAPALIGYAWRSAVQQAGFHLGVRQTSRWQLSIKIHKSLLTPALIGRMTAFFESGLLPLWHAGQEPADSSKAFAEWCGGITAKSAKNKFRGTVLNSI